MDENIERTAQTSEDNAPQDGTADTVNTTDDTEIELQNEQDDETQGQDGETDDTDTVDDDESGDGKADEPTADDPTAKKSRRDLPPEEQERNAIFAQKKREAEAREEARKETILEITGGVNPYTQEKMEDSEDIQEYLTMKEIEKAGLDPLTDFAKYLKTQRKTEIVKASEHEKSKKFVMNDRTEFEANHPEIKLNELFTDNAFQLFADGKLGKQPLTQIYDNFQKFVNATTKKAGVEVNNENAKRQTAVGSLSTTPKESKLNYETMDDDEFEIQYRKALNGELKK
jgi:hypothetical protein